MCVSHVLAMAWHIVEHGVGSVEPPFARHCDGFLVVFEHKTAALGDLVPRLHARTVEENKARVWHNLVEVAARVVPLVIEHSHHVLTLLERQRSYCCQGFFVHIDLLGGILRSATVAVVVHCFFRAFNHIPFLVGCAGAYGTFAVHIELFEGESILLCSRHLSHPQPVVATLPVAYCYGAAHHRRLVAGAAHHQRRLGALCHRNGLVHCVDARLNIYGHRVGAAHGYSFVDGFLQRIIGLCRRAVGYGVVAGG